VLLFRRGVVGEIGALLAARPRPRGRVPAPAADARELSSRTGTGPA
jgi:hypothetical protein